MTPPGTRLMSGTPYGPQCGKPERRQVDMSAPGPDRVNQYRIADGYIDRILNGEKPEAFISSPA